MKASELIAEIQKLMRESGTDPQIGAQSHGCCAFAHEIEAVEMGGSVIAGINTNDEVGMIVIRM